MFLWLLLPLLSHPARTCHGVSHGAAKPQVYQGELHWWGPTKDKPSIIQTCWGWRCFSNPLGQLCVILTLWGNNGHSEVDPDSVLASGTTIPNMKAGVVSFPPKEGQWHHPITSLSADPGLGTRSCGIPASSPTHDPTRELCSSFSFSLSLLWALWPLWGLSAKAVCSHTLFFHLPLQISVVLMTCYEFVLKILIWFRAGAASMQEDVLVSFWTLNTAE